MEIIPPKNQGRPGEVYQRPAAPSGATQTPQPPPAPPISPRPQPIVRNDDDNHGWRNILSTIGLFASAFLIAILLNTFVIQSYQVDGESMEPTLQNDDRLLVNKLSRTLARVDGRQYVPKRGDIIIFNQASLPGFVGQKQLVKRVIGLPGDRVVVKDGKITIYNSAHPDGFNPDTTGDFHISAPITSGETDNTLQKDELFVCGDNRANSEDSRFFGPIKTDQVVAKLVLRILPLSKAQSF
jgi:signal peptidase I